MFSAFFGHYLLNKGVVTPKQLSDVLEYQQEVRLKLGVIAINDGFMTGEQVEHVHQLQASKDRRFGEIALEEGYLSEDQLNHLLKQQKAENLILAQALIDVGIMDNKQFEIHIKDYIAHHSLSDEQFEALKAGNIDIALRAFAAFEKSETTIYHDYLSLFLKNLIRFVDPSVSIDRVQRVPSIAFDHGFKQRIKVDDTTYLTAICGEAGVLTALASQFSEDVMTELDDYAQDSVGEFLNLHNGLFTVNASNQGVEMTLTVQGYQEHFTVMSNETKNIYHIPVYASFGTFHLLVGTL